MNWRPLLHVAKAWHFWRCAVWSTRRMSADEMCAFHERAAFSIDRTLYPPLPIDPIEAFRKQNNL